MSSLGDNLNNANQNAQQLNQTLGETESVFGGLRDTLESINSELGKKINRVKDAKDAYSSLTSIAQKLQYQEEGMVRLSDKELSQLKDKAAIQVEEIKRAADKLAVEKTLAQTGRSIFELNGAAFETALQSLTTRQQLTDEEIALIRAKKEGFEIENDTLNKIKEEVQIREDVNSALGVTGGVLKGLNEIGGGFTKAFKLDKVAADMEEFAEQTIRAQGSVSRLAVLGKGLGSAFKNAFSTLTDPSVIIAGAVAGFNEVDKARVDFQRQTGQSLKLFSTNIDATNTRFITTADYIKTASELTRELGQNAAAIFTPEDLMEAAEMVEMMGMASKEAANLARLSKVNGGNIKAQNEAIIEGVNAANRQNRTAVGAGTILKDVANTSEEIAISYAGYPEKLGAAATAAKGLGMSLSDVDKIASSLLRFESSIAAELEAELLTGKALNLEKARELALANDLEGVAKELANQGITAASFSRMNRIQQEAQAKALGMSRQELSKMLLTQEATMDISKDALSDAQKQTLEQVKQEEAAEKFNKSIQKIQQSLAPIVGLFADILTPIAGVVSGVIQFLANSRLILIPLGIIALSYVPKIASGFAKVGKSIKNSLTTVRDLGKGLLKLATGKGSGALKEAVLGKKFKGGQFLPGGGRAKAGGQRVGGLFNRVKDKTDKVREAGNQIKPGKGTGIKENLTNLGDGLKAMAGGQVTQGILNLALAGPALLLALPSIPFLLFMGLTPLNKLQSNFTSLGNGLKKMGGGPVFAGIGALALAGPALAIANLAIPFLTFMALPLGPLMEAGLTGLANGLSSLGNNFASVAKGALALTILSASLIPAAFAFSLLSGVDPLNVILLSGSLIALGGAAALLGNLGANIILGAAALGVLGLALVPAAFAFSLLQGIDVGTIVAFSVALPLLSLAAAGLGFATPFIIAGAGALTILGLALIPASMAFSMIQGLDTNAIISFATGVGILASTVALLGFATPFIIAGAGALTILGLALIPASMAFSMIQGLDTNAIISFATGVGILASTVALLGFAAPLIIAGSFAISTLGLAMIPLSIGFERMAAANVEGLVTSLQGLAGVAPQLFGVAAGLGAISAGLAGIAGTGLLALPVIGALTALGTVSEGLSSIFGGGGTNEDETATKDEGSMKAIEQKLDQLIAVVSAGGDVYIDGAKVGKTLQLASSKMG